MRTLLSVVLSVGISTSAAADDALRFYEAADAYLKNRAEANEFSGAVLVAKEGEVLLAKGFGLANREHDVENSVDTIFRLGSVTKQFTAICILMLDRDGKLDVHGNVCDYLEECPDSWRNITIHHLLTHTSGIPNFTNMEDNLEYERLPTTVAATVERFRDLPLEFAPGTEMRYSNSGYVLLGRLIEIVSGQDYESFLQDRVWTPLGMSRSGYDRPARIIPGRASGYDKVEAEIVNCIPFAMDTPHAAGALYSSVGDLLKWDQALYTDELLPTRSLARMFDPFEAEFGSDDEGRPCYGWFKKSRNGRAVFEHAGGIAGFSSGVIRCPEEHLYVAVLGNFEWAHTMAIAQRLCDIYLDSAVAEPHSSQKP